MFLYNTATKNKETFTPLDSSGKVGMYTCGPTVYNYAHIGNLRTYVFEDILKRVLIANGYNIKHVMNITDVGHLTSDADTGEDKMESGSLREGKTVWEIAEHYKDAFISDFESLNCLRPDIWCKATDHIEDQINLVKRLEEKGFTYSIKDGIYFDTSKFPRYAEFARLDLESQKNGARVDVVEGKKNPSDFALWKFSPKNVKRQMEWESPWGIGFPGWHIECSAMSMKYLGESFDIHCGGVDHIPVHHTNEIAQAEAATGKTFVKYWAHGEFLVLDKGKMSKSSGEFLTLEKVCDEGFSPLDYRYFCFSAHYKSPLTFSWDGLKSARSALNTLRKKIAELKKSTNKNTEDIKDSYNSFLEVASDDLNMPKALAVVWNTLKDTSKTAEYKLAFLEKADEILGLDLMNYSEDNTDDSIDEEIKNLIEKRQKARSEKDFALADSIRDELIKKGIVLEDTPQGVQWKRL